MIDSWYFALSEVTIDRPEHDWRGLILAAVASARRHTRLRPIMVYDGQPSEFTKELERRDVTVIHHRVSFYDDLVRHAQAIGQDWWGYIASGAFLRTEIPLIHPGNDNVVYTDCDVMFHRDLPPIDCGSAPFAIVPEYADGVVGDYVDINSGVMVMNLAALRASLGEFSAFIRDNLDKLTVFDQTAYQLFYARQWQELPPELNWRPYWGYNEAARIVHWHGPKPEFVRYRCEGREVPAGYASWHHYLEQNPAAYCKYLSIWDDYRREADRIPSIPRPGAASQGSGTGLSAISRAIAPTDNSA